MLLSVKVNNAPGECVHGERVGSCCRAELFCDPTVVLLDGMKPEIQV